MLIWKRGRNDTSTINQALRETLVRVNNLYGYGEIVALYKGDDDNFFELDETYGSLKRKYTISDIRGVAFVLACSQNRKIMTDAEAEEKRD